MEWQVICTMFKTPPGARPSERKPSSTDLQYARPCVPPGWRAPPVQWGRNAADLCASGITCQKVVKIYRREIYNEEVRACKWDLQVCGLRLSFFPPHLFRLFRLYRCRRLNPRTSPATFFCVSPYEYFISVRKHILRHFNSIHMPHNNQCFYILVCLTWLLKSCCTWRLLEKLYFTNRCCSKSHTYVTSARCTNLTWCCPKSHATILH